MSDDISKELAKLEALAAGPSSSKKGATATIAQTLDSLDHAMALAEEEIERGADPDEVIKRVTKVIEAKKSDTEKGLKEWYNSLARLGKGIDKVRMSMLYSVAAALNELCCSVFTTRSTRYQRRTNLHRLYSQVTPANKR